MINSGKIEKQIICAQSILLSIILAFTMMSTYHASIVGHENQSGGKIAYILEVKDENLTSSKIVKLRYSEFRDIHAQLQQIVNKLKLNIVLPEFPARKIFGSTNKSEEAIVERQKSFVQYLNELLKIEKLTTLEVMRKYYIPDPNNKNGQKFNEVNIRINIDRYSLVDDAVIYYVNMRDMNSHEQWVYKARYSELRNLHDALVEAKVKSLPNFPKKKIFGLTNQNPDDIEKRREELEKYFRQIFSIQQIMKSEPVKYFLDESKKEAKKQKQFEAMRKMNKG